MILAFGASLATYASAATYLPNSPSCNGALISSVVTADRSLSMSDARVLKWIQTTGDNSNMPFLIVDKVLARVYVFDHRGCEIGAARALLGLAKGDASAPNIGHKRLAAIRPEERTTPAGRYVAFFGRDFEQDVLWIDYDAAISMHRVIKGEPSEHRAERLASNRSDDKRISYGCINVPPQFYDGVVRRAVRKRAIVYIMPETSASKFPFGRGRLSYPF